VILIRKAAIAATGLVFRQVPTFQLSIAVLICFVS